MTFPGQCVRTGLSIIRCQFNRYYDSIRAVGESSMTDDIVSRNFKEIGIIRENVRYQNSSRIPHFKNDTTLIGPNFLQ